ncbi:hypothetical protein MMC28_000525 [Mycoblastus sanguinarius]|nr:hypothetical protein [Mycoblastus sanguinarius]
MTGPVRPPLLTKSHRYEAVMVFTTGEVQNGDDQYQQCRKGTGVFAKGWLVLTDGSNASYQGEEGSEEAASQREDISLRCTPLNNDDHSHLFDDDSQDDSNEESDDEGASVGSGSEGE